DSVRAGCDQDHDASLAHREFGGINAFGGLPQVVVCRIRFRNHDVSEAGLSDSVDGLRIFGALAVRGDRVAGHHVDHARVGVHDDVDDEAQSRLARDLFHFQAHGVFGNAQDFSSGV